MCPIIIFMPPSTFQNSAVDKSLQHQKFSEKSFGIAENRTKGGLLRGKNATSVPFGPDYKICLRNFSMFFHFLQFPLIDTKFECDLIG